MGTDLALHVRQSRAAAEAINMVAKFRLFLDKNKISLTKETQIARSTCSSGFFHSFIKSDNFSTNFPSLLRKNIIEISDPMFLVAFNNIKSAVLKIFQFSLTFLQKVFP